jgi:putative serine protease PepD
MTDPLLWLDGDPTDGRTATIDEPAAAPAPPSDPGPAPRRGGRFRSAFAGGLVAAALVGGGALVLSPGHSPVAAINASQRGNVEAIYAAASPSVVTVKTQEGSGTGFVVNANGTLVTNAHVVGQAQTVQLLFSDESTATAQVTGVDASKDLAVLKVDTNKPLKALELADSNAVHTGELAVAIGSPLGLDQTATAGIVSGTGRHVQSPNGVEIDRVIQTDAPINPGNSGGPLLDTRGRVIGITTQIATGGAGNGNIGIGFAVPANRVREVLPALAGGQQIVRPYLGVTSAPAARGAQVVTAASGGPAAKAGLKKGDVIVRVDGRTVSEPDDVAGAVEQHKPGDVVQVTVLRNGARVSFSVELGKRPPHAP